MTILYIICSGLLEQRISELLGGKTGSQLCPGSPRSADGRVALLSFPPDPLDLRQEAGPGGQQPARHPQEALHPGQGVPGPAKVRVSSAPL